MAGYAHDVIRPELRQERRHDSSCKQVLRRVGNLLICNASLVNECARVRLDQILARFNDQKILYQYRQQAEETGITTLQNFPAPARLQPAAGLMPVC